PPLHSRCCTLSTEPPIRVAQSTQTFTPSASCRLSHRNRGSVDTDPGAARSVSTQPPESEAESTMCGNGGSGGNGGRGGNGGNGGSRSNGARGQGGPRAHRDSPKWRVVRGAVCVSSGSGRPCRDRRRVH